MIGQRFPDTRSAVEHVKGRIVESRAQERRAHERRQKFIEDCNLIRNRRRNDPCIPFLPGHDAVEWFTKLESNGIWKLVFEYVTNPSDVTSAYFTCELFRNHLEEKRNMLMLPKAFGVLRDTNHLKYSGFREEVDEESSDILTLRHVSEGCKKATEEEFLLNEDFSEPIRVLEHWGFWEERNVTCRFRNVRDVDFAMEKLRDINPNSYSLLRLLNVVDEGSSSSDQGAFYSQIGEFLDLHGAAVWAFKFGQAQYRAPGEFNYESLCMVVSKLPNLKAMYLHTMGSHYSLHSTENGWRLAEEANERLRLSILRNPFPGPPTLESLMLYSFPAQNAFLVAGIVEGSVNLKALRLGNLGLLDESPIPDFVWERLRNLRLEHLDVAYCMNNEHFIEDFLRLREFDWPLKYLRFNIMYGGRLHETSASDILEVLSHFNDTLKEVTFFVAPARHFTLLNDGRNVVTDLSHLEKLILPRFGNDED